MGPHHHAETGIPDPRLPFVGQVIDVRQVFGFTAARVVGVIIDGRRNAVAADTHKTSPSLPLKVVGSDHEFVDIFDAERHMIPGDAFGLYLFRIHDEDRMMILTAIREQEGGKAAGNIGHAEIEHIDIPGFDRIDIILGRGVSDMVDQARLGTLVPLSVGVPALDRIDGVGWDMLARDNIAFEDAKAERDAHGVHGVKGSVFVTADLALCSEFLLQLIQILGVIDAPDGFSHAGAFQHIFPKCRIGHVPNKDGGAFGNAEVGTFVIFAVKRESKIHVKPFGLRDIRDAVDQ